MAARNCKGDLWALVENLVMGALTNVGAKPPRGEQCGIPAARPHPSTPFWPPAPSTTDFLSLFLTRPLISTYISYLE